MNPLGTMFWKKSGQEEPKSTMSKYNEEANSAAAPISPPRFFMNEEMMGPPPQIPSEPKRYRDQRPPNPPLDFTRIQASVIQHTSRRGKPPPPPPPRGPPRPPLAVGERAFTVNPELQPSATIVGRMPAQQLRPYMNSGEPPGLTPQRIPAVNPPLESQTQSPSPSLGLPSKNRSVSDLVRDSKLIAFQTDDTSIVRHIVYTSNPHMRQRRMKTEEAWKRREKLGTGAFGQVYLEELLSGSEAGKLRAVKEIAKTPPQDPRKEIDYTRELEAIAKFSHPKYVHCFVKSYGWYESDLTIFITMEYASKGNLQGYLTKQFPEGEAQQITYQIAEGISYMHENSFAHRDLKPAAKEEVTAFHTLVGTRGYLAPEILGFFSPEDTNAHQYGQGNNMYTVSVDLWALGAIAFRLLTNQDIFVNPPDVGRYVILKQPFPTSPLLEKRISDTCINFIENIMARSPSDRLSAHQALTHAWLSELHDPVQQLDGMSTMAISSTNRPTGNMQPDYSDSTASAQWPTWAQ
ncbi:unnamed protein product [Clonostachys rosea f. rosea IK726]|uniref:Uncharacterized protein n=1 Tax=Clonostachys rosea f. rosea IK726 TaxID=1349383 RepID=A0ACA9UA79_BIOOC|nr:unnamed protein product [Clonostachys rosea f. rosea IK726]